MSHPDVGFGSPLKALLMLMAIISYAFAFPFAFHLVSLLVDDKEDHGLAFGLVGVFLGFVLGLTGVAWVVVTVSTPLYTIEVVGNRLSRARFYHPYRVAPALHPGLHRMSKRRAVAYANAGFSAAEAQKLEFGARSERPTEDALMMLAALKRTEK